MIYTLTLNPSIDYIVSMDEFQLHKTNRTTYEQMLPGGKGLNVSTVLQNLGSASTALGFVAGFTGEEIKRLTKEIGVAHDFIEVPKGASRINVKLKDIEGTEINGNGPEIGEEQIEALMQKLEKLEFGDILVMAGSIPGSLPETIYSDIMKRLETKGVLFVVDATKKLLLHALEHRPFLIKPNNYELGEIFGVELSDRKAVVPYARQLQKKGARNVLVSMAGDGAVLLDEKGAVHMAAVPKGTLVNAVGAGDSMVAGFLAGWNETKNYRHAFQMGVAAGSASAYSEFLATKEEIQRLYLEVKADYENNGCLEEFS